MSSSSTRAGRAAAPPPGSPDAGGVEPSTPSTTSPDGGGTIEVIMPQMGVSVAEGTITAWLRRPGDRVEADEPLCEASTDKIDVELPSPGSGVVAEILVEEGETVAVGTVLARISEQAPISREAPGPAGALADGSPPSGPGAGEIDRSRFYSPVVRRIAAEHDVDLDLVPGRGVGGRVRKLDLLGYIAAREGAAANGDGETRPLHTESPYRGDPETAIEELVGPTRREPIDPTRRAIAEHMVASRRVAAHATTVVEADFSVVVRDRAERREAMARRGVRLTYLAYVARATVEALGEHPVLNASVEDGEIVYHEDVNLGIAVALDDGLVVPVIRKAQRLSLEGMAAAIDDLAARARGGRLAPDDLAGGTFTITNPGRFGAVIATPIINQPEVAILDLEAIVRRPVAIDGPDGDEVSIRPMSYLCMSWDHRALDGADAARFLGCVRRRIERTEER